MNNLLIERVTENRFEFSLNGGEKISDSKPMMQTVGTKCYFRTFNGSSIIGIQNVDVTEIIVRDTFGATGDFSFTTVPEIWIKLISLNFFDGVISGGGGSGGASAFTQLSDTFQFFGNNGKVPVVNEAELKLTPTVFYNIKDFVELGDVAISALVVGKFVSVGLVNNKPKIILVDAPTGGGTESKSAIGSANYDDLGTTATPIQYSGTEVFLTNDTLGALTDTSDLPFGVSELWDNVNSGLDFSGLSIGDFVSLRVNIRVTTTVANQQVFLTLRLNENQIDSQDVILLDRVIDTADTVDLWAELPLVILNQNMIDLVHKMYFNSSASASITVKSFQIVAIRKTINVVDFRVDAEDFNLVVQGNGANTSFNLPFNYDKIILFASGNFNTAGVDYNRNGTLVTFLNDMGVNPITVTGLGLFIEGVQAQNNSTDNIIKYFDSAEDNLTAMVAEINALNPPLNITQNEIYRFKLTTGEIFELKDKGKGVYGLGNLQVVEADFEKIKVSESESSVFKKYANGGISRADVNDINIGFNAINLTFGLYAATGESSFAEGSEVFATGIASHAEGTQTVASGRASHAEGTNTVASSSNSHSEGDTTIASGDASHSEGFSTTASGLCSHAEGTESTASGNSSHAEGKSNFARSFGEHSGGNFGTDYTPTGTDTDRLVNYGNGTSTLDRKDAFTIFKNGAVRIFRATLASILNPLSGMIIFDSGNNNRPTVHDGTSWKALKYFDEGDSSQLPSGTITTTTSITTATLTDDSSTQNGKIIGIANGVNVINFGVDSAITASFVLLGTGDVTFVQGAGRTLVLKTVPPTATLTGTGSTASLASFGTTDYLYINNI